MIDLFLFSLASINCNFQNNTCGWSQMSGDDFNWLPNKGETNTSQTGPLTDHTFGDSSKMRKTFAITFNKNMIAIKTLGYRFAGISRQRGQVVKEVVFTMTLIALSEFDPHLDQAVVSFTMIISTRWIRTSKQIQWTRIRRNPSEHESLKQQVWIPSSTK